jgi:hypothetical protein
MSKIFKHFTLLDFDRSFSKGLGSQLAWLAGIMCLVYIVLTAISYIGEMYAGNGNSRFLDILLVLIDPGSGSESMSSTLVIVCAVLGLIIFSGMLISVISNVLERRVESYTKGETNYNISDHIVILGFNKSIPSLIKHILENKYQGEDPYILIICNRNIEETRDWLHASISDQHEDNIILMNGVRNKGDDIKRLRLEHGVKEIYILGEEDEPAPAHDAINMECANIIATILKDKNINTKIECHVQLDSQIMFSILQKTEVDEVIKEQLIFHPFNFNEIWAQKVLATIPNEYKSLDDKGITRNSNKHAHLIIAGMNPMSWSLAVNAAHILHFPNFKEGDFNTCSTITFIDTEAVSKGKEFRGHFRNLFDLARWRDVNDNQCMNKDEYWTDPIADENSHSTYKHLSTINFMDIQWEFIEGNIFNTNILKYIESVTTQENTIATIALCEEESDKNSSICLSLSEATRLSANEILLRQNESDIAIEKLKEVYGFENIKAFGMMNECYKENLISDKYGKLINACYGDYSTGKRQEVDINDEKAVEDLWEKEKNQLNKWSSIYCANMLFYKLRSLGIDVSAGSKKVFCEDIKNAAANCMSGLTRLEHYRWVTEKLLLGFRPLLNDDEIQEWSKNKKLMKKQMKHIDILPFSKLPKNEQEKDNDVNTHLHLLYEIVERDLGSAFPSAGTTS